MPPEKPKRVTPEVTTHSAPTPSRRMLLEHLANEQQSLASKKNVVNSVDESQSNSATLRNAKEAEAILKRNGSK